MTGVFYAKGRRHSKKSILRGAAGGYYGRQDFGNGLIPDKAREFMIYLFGTVGFIGGFLLGQLLLLRLLRGVSREEMMSNKKLQRKYGLLNWLIALAAGASAVWVYQEYFF